MVRFTNFKSSPHTKDHHKYEMSGVLSKMGEVNRSWKERFFILEEDKLFYYKNSESTKAIAYIPLNEAYVRVSPEFYPKMACFEIVTCQRIYKLQASNFDLMKQWIQHCQNFSKIGVENELIRQVDVQIHQSETKLCRELEDDLHFEPIPLDSYFYTCKYNTIDDISNTIEEQQLHRSDASCVVIADMEEEEEDVEEMEDSPKLDEKTTPPNTRKKRQILTPTSTPPNMTSSPTQDQLIDRAQW